MSSGARAQPGRGDGRWRMLIMMMMHSRRAALQSWCDRCNMVCCARLQMGLRRSDRLNVEPESAMKGAGKPDTGPPPTVPDFLAFALQTSMGMTRTSVFHPTAQSLSVRVRVLVCAAVSDGRAGSRVRFHRPFYDATRNMRTQWCNTPVRLRAATRLETSALGRTVARGPRAP